MDDTEKQLTDEYNEAVERLNITSKGTPENAQATAVVVAAYRKLKAYKATK